MTALKSIKEKIDSSTRVSIESEINRVESILKKAGSPALQIVLDSVVDAKSVPSMFELEKKFENTKVMCL